jgi:hypothetical protein
MRITVPSFFLHFAFVTVPAVWVDYKNVENYAEFMVKEG